MRRQLLFICFALLCSLPHIHAAVRKQASQPGFMDEPDDDPQQSLFPEGEDDHDNAAEVQHITDSKPVSEDEEDALDADEFVGVPTKNKDKPAQSTKKLEEVPTAVKEVPAKPQNYYAEYAALVFIAIYAVNFVIGRAKNEAIANTWFEATHDLFDQQFAVVGAYKAPDLPPMLKESQHCFKVYASGRRFCNGFLATLELVQRQDLFSWLFQMIDLAPSRDMLIIDVPMTAEEVDPFVMALARKRDQNKMRKSNKDLENFAAVVNSDRIPASLCLLSDAPSMEEDIFESKTLKVIHEHEDLFCSIHVSDQIAGPFKNSRHGLRFQFFVPANGDMARLKKLMEMSLYLIDVVATKRLGSNEKSKALKLRAAYQAKVTREQREEEAQRRIEEKKQAEEKKRKELENSGTLTKEQLRKREEREHKLALKKRQPKVKVLR